MAIFLKFSRFGAKKFAKPRNLRTDLFESGANSIKYPWLPQDDVRLGQTRAQVIEKQLHFTDTTLTLDE